MMPLVGKALVGKGRVIVEIGGANLLVYALVFTESRRFLCRISEYSMKSRNVVSWIRLAIAVMLLVGSRQVHEGGLLTNAWNGAGIERRSGAIALKKEPYIWRFVR